MTHEAVIATTASKHRFEFSIPNGDISSDDCYISYLPLAHILEWLVPQIIFYLVLQTKTVPFSSLSFCIIDVVGF